MKSINKDNVSDHIDDLIGVAESIEPYKVTILTGSNGIGKSFVRKIVGFKIAEKLGKDTSKSTVASTSMEQRTGSNPEWGAMAGIMRDLGWTPTSRETLNKIEQLLKIEDRYIVIDEPELGMGEELVRGLIEYLNKNLTPDLNLGVLIITHSRDIVNYLRHDKFINVDGMNVIEWLNREIIPMHFDELEQRTSLMFDEIRDRTSKTK
jgi:Fe-S cluster assembly ATPase SufC